MEDLQQGRGSAWAAGVALVAGVILTACGSTSPGGPPSGRAVYTSAEAKQLTVCVGLSDTARAIAQMKLNGQSQEFAKSHYSLTPDSQLAVQLVDKVYAEKSTPIWDYSVNFFRECGQNLAEVPPDRISLAAFCWQNAMIAGIAREQSAAGTAREKVYDEFSGLGPSARAVIDRAYEGTRSRADQQLTEWNHCMQPITAR